MSREIRFRWWNGQQMVSHRNIEVLAKNIGNLKCLMQYTGLKDKNGVEIYEGDIVSADDITCEVEWRRHGWVAKWSSIRNGKVDGYRRPDLGFRSHEVIGNIYDNPELLEVDDERQS